MAGRGVPRYRLENWERLCQQVWKRPGRDSSGGAEAAAEPTRRGRMRPQPRASMQSSTLRLAAAN